LAASLATSTVTFQGAPDCASSFADYSLKAYGANFGARPVRRNIINRSSELCAILNAQFVHLIGEVFCG
jgi:hypothetical protein